MSTWNVETPLADEYVGDPPSPLASLVYLTRALRRRWRTWAVAGMLGVVLAGAYTWHFPPKSVATVALALQHPGGSDPIAAMQTDTAILRTRTVAGKTVAALGEHTSPDRFMATYSGTATTSTILTIRVAADNPTSAVRAAKTLASVYLAYRATQLRDSSNAQIAGVKSQIASLKQQLTAANAQYSEFHNAPGGSTVAATALRQANSLRAQIGSLQTTVQAAQNATDALITSSAVLDPAAAVPSSPTKHLILTLFTGGVGGTALGGSIVVFAALTSTRLRRREDVAAATGAAVTHTAPRLRPGLHERFTRRGRRRLSSGASYGLQVLAQGLGSPLAGHDVDRVALVTLDNEDDGLAVVAFAAAQLSSERRHVFLADLSDSGRLGKKVRKAVGAAVRPSIAPTVYRPDVPPPFARGPLADGPGKPSDLGRNDPARARWDAADVVLAVVPADLDTGFDHVAGWADRAVLLVTAGRSSADQLSTTAGLLRSAGLEVGSILMVGTDQTDHSLGRLGTAVRTPAGEDAALPRTVIS